MDGRKRAYCRRLVLQEPVTLPARSQLDVQTMVVYPTYSSTWVDGEKAWMSEAGEIAGKGVQSSRTLIPARSKDVPLRMMNLRDVAVRLNKGATVAELQPLDDVETVTSPTKTERQQECISELIRGTDYRLLAADKEKLSGLLEEFSDTMSVDEYDMGQTGAGESSCRCTRARAQKWIVRTLGALHFSLYWGKCSRTSS